MFQINNQIKNIILYNRLELFFITLSIIGVLIIYFFPLISDGLVYRDTARRMYNNEFDLLYSDLRNSGPYIYPPYSSLFFYPLAFVENVNVTGIISFISISITVYKLVKIKEFESKNIYIILLLLFIIYGFILIESIVIGQIDGILLGLLYVAFFSKYKRGIWGILCFSVVVAFKPQLILLIYWHYKNSIHWKCIFIIIVSHITLCILLFILIEADYDLFFILFEQFLERIQWISKAYGVANQSLTASINRLWYLDSFASRYHPRLIVSSAPMSVNPVFAFLDTMIIFGLLISMVVLFYRKTVWNLERFPTLILPILPIISPVFWHVHTVYLLPITIVILSEIKFSKEKLKFFWILCPILANPILIGGYYADIALSYGVLLIFSILSLIIILRSEK